MALDTVFTDTSDFIIIGLTGRTGSGCSTAANLLSQKTLPLPDPGTSHYKENEGRKYRIIKKYIEKKWQPFHWLQLRAILTKYVLQLNFSEFQNLVALAVKQDLPAISKSIGYFKAEYDIARARVTELLEIPEDTIESLERKKNVAFELYFNELPAISNEIRGCLQKISASAYTAVYQYVGDNVRSSGRADSAVFDPKKIFSFARTISKVVLSAQHVSRMRNQKCYIVLDAIRNPYEAVFLRERHAGFYLVSINTENENRLTHLRASHKFTDQQIEELDNKEYPKKLSGDKKFSSQNIQKCIELSDIHINNPRSDYFGSSELASQLAWYVSLMMHPGLVMPTSMESCMQIAYTVKKSSGCISRQVGAVVTDKSYSVKAVGWNNTPTGQVPCLLRSADDLINGVDPIAYSRYEKKNEKFGKAITLKYQPLIFDAHESGRNLSYCFKDIQNEVENEKNQVHTRSLHAEENAFLQIAKFGGQKILGGILFTTASPCELCAKKAYQLGISIIYYIDPYPGIATSHVLSSGKHQPSLVLFRGAIGSAYHRLYQPIMPFKDELEMLLTVPRKDNNKEMQIRKLNAEIADLRKQVELLQAKIPGVSPKL